MNRFFTLLLLLNVFVVYGQEESRYVPETDTLVLQKLEEWQDIKFGLLMHWGPYSQRGIVESWSICPEDYGWCQRNVPEDSNDYETYVKDYEALKNTFNPVEFDPSRWAGAAANAGMRYVIFTTKHHDGFCMFDTEYTDYKITDPDCPFSTSEKANVTLEIFNAFRNEGLLAGAYFSKPDWHNDDYWWSYFPPKDRNVNYDPERYPEKWNSYVDFTHGQILELLSNYGKIDILWLDGGWVANYSDEDIAEFYQKRLADSENGFMKGTIVRQDIRMDELVEKGRELQPGLIVVDRAVEGINQNYLTPENRVPEEALPYPWESCIIAGGGWSYAFDAKYMSGHEGVHLLVDIVCKGGNLLLNIAPSPDGTWDEGAYQLLEEIGAWMDVNKEAIYETRAIAPYKESKICYTNLKNSNTVYAIYMADENELVMPESVTINSFCSAPETKVHLLGVDQDLAWKSDGQGMTIKIPKKIRNNPPCKYAWVFKLTIE